MKGVLLAVLFAGCVLFGKTKAEACKERPQTLQHLCAFVGLCRDGIVYACLSPGELVQQAARRSDLKEVAFIKKMDGLLREERTFFEAWQETLSPLPLCDEERGILLTWGETLGKSDRDSQRLSCEGVMERLMEKKNRAFGETEKQCRMWLSLGAVAGAFAVVLFW